MISLLDYKALTFTDLARIPYRFRTYFQRCPEKLGSSVGKGFLWGKDDIENYFMAIRYPREFVNSALALE